VSFPGAVEPPRREWFIAETQPTSALSALDDANPQILAPTSGTIIALDPDIPSDAQRVVFEASRGAQDSDWILDGRSLARVRGEFLWTPSPGAHTLSIARSGHALETTEFSVRGREEVTP
jgi:penicillin-binding protein 1C